VWIAPGDSKNSYFFHLLQTPAHKRLTEALETEEARAQTHVLHPCVSIRIFLQLANSIVQAHAMGIGLNFTDKDIVLGPELREFEDINNALWLFSEGRIDAVRPKTLVDFLRPHNHHAILIEGPPRIEDFRYNKPDEPVKKALPLAFFFCLFAKFSPIFVSPEHSSD